MWQRAAVPPVLYQRTFARAPADTVLVVGSEAKEIPVHRIVLFCSSPYFERLVHYHRQERQSSSTVVQQATSGAAASDGREATMRILLPDIPAGVMLQIVRFCYSGTVDVSSSNVDELLRVADMFVIDPVVRACHSLQQ